jgi:hypothetical protein
VIHAEPVLISQQQEAKKIHKEMQKKDRMIMFYSDEFSNCVKTFNVYMYSIGLCIEGIVDCIMKSAYKLMLMIYPIVFRIF